MVRDMKAAKAPEIDVKAAVSELKKRKKALQDKENELTADDIKIDRNAFETCLKKRFIFRQERFRWLYFLTPILTPMVSLTVSG